MIFANRMTVIRGGGDLGSGAAYQLSRAGFPVVVAEIERPLAIRRAVSFAAAVTEGSVTVDGVTGRRAGSAAEAVAAARDGTVAVLVSPDLPRLDPPVAALVDARMAKRNLDTTIDQAPLVVALGPGFTAGVDCHAVIETMRGHRLGRVIWDGAAAPNTGVPGMLGGAAAERVIRADVHGVVEWTVAIGDVVAGGQQIGTVATAPITTAIGGVVRGLITPGSTVRPGLKIADVDPRAEQAACFEISDKARLVGAGVLEAVLTWLNRL